MLFFQSERGSPGGGRRGCGPLISDGRSSRCRSHLCQRVAAWVCSGRFALRAGLRANCASLCVKLHYRRRRLNAHLLSIVSSRSCWFCMPVEVAAGGTRRGGVGHQGPVSRLSSFGFSGTIAHGAFASSPSMALPRMADTCRLISSLFRNITASDSGGTAQCRMMLVLDSKGL